MQNVMFFYNRIDHGKKRLSYKFCPFSYYLSTKLSKVTMFLFIFHVFCKIYLGSVQAENYQWLNNAHLVPFFLFITWEQWSQKIKIVSRPYSKISLCSFFNCSSKSDHTLNSFGDQSFYPEAVTAFKLHWFWNAADGEFGRKWRKINHKINLSISKNI